MSTIEVDKIIPQSGTATQVGENGDTINVPSGATLNINSGATIANNGTATGFDTDTNDKVKVSSNDTTQIQTCLLYTSPSPRDRTRSRMPSSA